MSYQAITDIIVNPNQLRDLQLSSTVKDSPNTSSSVSFADFLASYTSEEPAKPEISDVLLGNTYTKLKTVILDKDMESLEMIIVQLDEYRLKDADRIRIDKLAGMMESSDWDGMRQLADNEF